MWGWDGVADTELVLVLLAELMDNLISASCTGVVVGGLEAGAVPPGIGTPGGVDFDEFDGGGGVPLGIAT